MKAERPELLLSRVIEAGYSYAGAVDDCFAIFFKRDELNEHLRNSRNKSHKRFAAYLNSTTCSECGEVTTCGSDHDYLWHRSTYERRMRELLPYNIPTEDAIPRFSLCFDIERVFRSGSSSDPHAQDATGEISKLCDVIESLHKRLIIMENKFHDYGKDDFSTEHLADPYVTSRI